MRPAVKQTMQTRMAVSQSNMFEGHKVIAIEKTHDKVEKGASWNNAAIRWFFLHQTALDSKSYQISLQMVYLSSKRDVKVNGQLKHSSMTTFGFDCDFGICPGLAGKIKQQGINFNFELYINGVAFTQLESSKPKYEALSELALPSGNQKFTIENTKKSQMQVTRKQLNVEPKLNLPETGKAKVKEISHKEEELNQEQKIKETQKELLKILKAQKQQKK